MPTAPALPATAIADQAKQLGLGVVDLAVDHVAQAPTDILPLPVVESSRIFPYHFDTATQTLSIAVADPARLKQAAPTELQAQRKLGRKLKLELVVPATFDALLPQIRERFRSRQTANSKPQTASRDGSLSATATSGSPIADRRLPMVDLSTITIPRSVFLKIPHDVATKFRIIAFAAPNETHVKLATDRPTDAGVKRVIDVIRTKRGVTVDLHEAPGSQVDDLIDAYASSADPISLVAPRVTTSVPISESTSALPTTKESLATTESTKPAPPIGAASSPVPVLAPSVVPVIPPLQPVKPVSAPTAQPSNEHPPLTGKQSPVPSLPTKPNEPAQAVTPAASVLPKQVSTSSDAMPIDTSPVTTPVDTAKPGKIQLAAPLPSLSFQPLKSKLPTEAASQLASAATVAPPVASTPAPTVIQPVVVLPPVVSTSPAPVSSNAPTPASMSMPPMSLPTPVAPLQSLPNPGSASGTVTSAALTTLGPVSSDDQNLDTSVGSTIRSPAELEAVVKTGLVPKLLAGILQYAVNTGASDIHVEAETTDLRIRFRVDGQLQDVLHAPLGLHAPLVSRLKILAKMKIDEQRVPQDGRFGATTANREIDFRVSTLPAIHGEKVVMRILDKTTSLKAIDQLGIDGSNGQRVTAALAKPFGIILVTGPTGSGKTTTLYAMLATVNKPGINIVTLEDPVEYELPGITQTQVKPKIGFSFAEGLRSILRQDPDVIMVGEIRDRETASLATHAALTGHLVLSTLHTNNAAGAIPRFLDMGVEPFLIASSMEAVIGQRLVRKLCEACRQPAQLTAAVQQNIQAELARSSVAELKAKAGQPLQLFSPKGCDKCHDGYRGRIGIYEVMTVSPEVETLTAKKAPLTEIEALAIQQGMVTMKQDGIGKAFQGLTSIDEILRVTTSD